MSSDQNKNKNDNTQKDAKWQEDKINVANNQTGNDIKKDVKDDKNTNHSNTKDNKPAAKDTETKITEAKEAREDSILSRPKTETYETNQGDDIGTLLKNENYTHTEEERKRDESNRNKRDKSKSEHTY